MVDWMIEVLSSYKCSNQTFFLAINTMDLYLQKTNVVHEVADLHLVGVASMFIASKYEEVYALRLSVIYEKIAHKKLTMEQIKRKEGEILKTLEFNLSNATPFDFMMNALYQLNLQKILSDKLYDYLQKVCAYLAKMTVHDYDLLSQQTYSELAAAALFVAFKIIEQLNKNFPLTDMVKIWNIFLSL